MTSLSVTGRRKKKQYHICSIYYRFYCNDRSSADERFRVNCIFSLKGQVSDMGICSGFVCFKYL